MTTVRAFALHVCGWLVSRLFRVMERIDSQGAYREISKRFVWYAGKCHRVKRRPW